MPRRRARGGLAGAADVADVRRLARRRAPRVVFDYVDGAAEGELSMARAAEAFARVEFRPHVLRDVSRVDTGTEILPPSHALGRAGAGDDPAGLVVSNHGGRQLDRSPTPLELLPEVASAVGDRTEVFLDGGVRGGADVAAAVALGARACLVGRAYLYGLMAGGEAGVDRVLAMSRGELARTLALLSASGVDGLDGDVVRLR